MTILVCLFVVVVIVVDVVAVGNNTHSNGAGEQPMSARGCILTCEDKHSTDGLVRITTIT